MNHYANKVARGPGEGEDRGRGLSSELVPV